MNTEPQALNIKEFVCKWRFLMNRVLAIPNFQEDLRDRIFVVSSHHMLVQWA